MPQQICFFLLKHSLIYVKYFYTHIVLYKIMYVFVKVKQKSYCGISCEKVLTWFLKYLNCRLKFQGNKLVRIHDKPGEELHTRFHGSTAI